MLWLSSKDQVCWNWDNGTSHWSETIPLATIPRSFCYTYVITKYCKRGYFCVCKCLRNATFLTSTWVVGFVHGKFLAAINVIWLFFSCWYKAKKRNKSVSRDARALLFYGLKSRVAFFFFVIFVSKKIKLKKMKNPGRKKKISRKKAYWS